MKREIIIAGVLLVIVALLSVAACTGTPGKNSTSTTSGAAPADSPTADTTRGDSNPPGTPPLGTPPAGGSLGGNMTPPSGSGGGPGGAPPSEKTPAGSSVSSSYTLSGAFTADGTTKTETDGLYTSAARDVSAVFVSNGGNLILHNPTIETGGDTSSSDASSFYGLNAAVLATGGSTVTLNGGTITTIGSGANGAFPTGTGSTIILNGVTIRATGGGGHAVMATNGGTLILTDMDLETTGANGAPLATDRGSGTVTATRGTVLASGRDSPGIYSTGVITVNDASVTATGAEAAVIEGFNRITLSNTSLTGGVEKTGGTMIYQSMSGDADVGTGTFSMTGGSYTVTAGPAFFITNTNAVITLQEVRIASVTDTLIKAAGTDRWGTSGKNGGAVTFTADKQELAGSLITDSISSIDAMLKNGSTLTGSINKAALTLDASSTWIVTGDSALTTLSDTSGISGTSITNIYGNGHTVTYDAGLESNRALGGKTYTLNGGGTLVPA
ncbi:MAG: hypothetical protein GYA23_01370 [Methanomicrobiales archaeon]|nr:hypothetical protein [Methanomicrobiales archaeon]